MANSQAQAEEEERGVVVNDRQQEEREVVVNDHQQEKREVVVNNEQAPKLRYLGFIQVAVAQAVVCLAGLYGVAKHHAGLLRPAVDVTESTVKGLVGPVYCKFHRVPLDILAFVDRKVDDTAHKLDRHLPGPLKAASAQACAVARAVTEVGRELTTEAQQSGLKATARVAYAKVKPMAKGMYGRYEPAAEHLAVSAWRSLNSLPVFPHVSQIVVPTVAYCAAKYNMVVDTAARRGYIGARYLPTVPTERIAKVFAEANGAAETQTQ